MSGQEARASTRDRESGMMRLLIADDSEILRSRLIELLSEVEEVKVVGEVRESQETIKAVQRLEPDIVILDIRMRGDGILALEEIKKKAKPPIVIMFTNYPYLQYRKKCLDAGADFFFYKSTEFEALLALLKKLVRKINV
jgi:DNA-binding NarL/FixJ family response regulator